MGRNLKKLLSDLPGSFAGSILFLALASLLIFLYIVNDRFANLDTMRAVTLGVVSAALVEELKRLVGHVAKAVEARPKSQILSPPCGHLTSLLQFLMPERLFAQIFAEIISDGREEYFEALAAGEKWKARWRHVQIYLSVGNALFACFMTSVAKRFVQMWKLL